MKYKHYSPSAPVTLLELPHLPSSPSSAPSPAVNGHASHHTSVDCASSNKCSGRAGSGAAASSSASAENGATNGATAAAPQQHAAGNQLRSALRAAADEEAAQLLQAGGALRVVLLRTSLPPGHAPGWLRPPAPPLGSAAAAAGAANGAALNGALHGAPVPLSPDPCRPASPQLLEYCLGSLEQPALVARELFGALRAADEAGADAIVVEGVGESHEGLAVMNRLRKAASRVVAVRL